MFIAFLRESCFSCFGKNMATQKKRKKGEYPLRENLSREDKCESTFLRISFLTQTKILYLIKVSYVARQNFLSHVFVFYAKINNFLDTNFLLAHF